MSTTQKNRKKKHIADGVFKAELHTFFLRVLDDSGYTGFDLVNTTTKK